MISMLHFLVYCMLVLGFRAAQDIALAKVAVKSVGAGEGLLAWAKLVADFAPKSTTDASRTHYETSAQQDATAVQSEPHQVGEIGEGL